MRRSKRYNTDDLPARDLRFRDKRRMVDDFEPTLQRQYQPSVDPVSVPGTLQINEPVLDSNVLASYQNTLGRSGVEANLSLMGGASPTIDMNPITRNVDGRAGQAGQMERVAMKRKPRLTDFQENETVMDADNAITTTRDVPSGNDAHFLARQGKLPTRTLRLEFEDQAGNSQSNQEITHENFQNIVQHRNDSINPILQHDTSLFPPGRDGFGPMQNDWQAGVPAQGNLRGQDIIARVGFAGDTNTDVNLSGNSDVVANKFEKTLEGTYNLPGRETERLLTRLKWNTMPPDTIDLNIKKGPQDFLKGNRGIRQKNQERLFTDTRTGDRISILDTLYQDVGDDATNPRLPDIGTNREGLWFDTTLPDGSETRLPISYMDEMERKFAKMPPNTNPHQTRQWIGGKKAWYSIGDVRRDYQKAVDSNRFFDVDSFKGGNPERRYPTARFYQDELNETHPNLRSVRKFDKMRPADEREMRAYENTVREEGVENIANDFTIQHERNVLTPAGRTEPLFPDSGLNNYQLEGVYANFLRKNPQLLKAFHDRKTFLGNTQTSGEIFEGLMNPENKLPGSFEGFRHASKIPDGAHGKGILQIDHLANKLRGKYGEYITKRGVPLPRNLQEGRDSLKELDVKIRDGIHTKQSRASKYPIMNDYPEEHRERIRASNKVTSHNNLGITDGYLKTGGVDWTDRPVVGEQWPNTLKSITEGRPNPFEDVLSRDAVASANLAGNSNAYTRAELIREMRTNLNKEIAQQADLVRKQNRVTELPSGGISIDQREDLSQVLPPIEEQVNKTSEWGTNLDLSQQPDVTGTAPQHGNVQPGPLPALGNEGDKKVADATPATDPERYAQDPQYAQQQDAELQNTVDLSSHSTVRQQQIEKGGSDPNVIRQKLQPGQYQTGTPRGVTMGSANTELSHEATGGSAGMEGNSAGGLTSYLDAPPSMPPVRQMEVNNTFPAAFPPHFDGGINPVLQTDPDPKITAQPLPNLDVLNAGSDVPMEPTETMDQADPPRSTNYTFDEAITDVGPIQRDRLPNRQHPFADLDQVAFRQRKGFAHQVKQDVPGTNAGDANTASRVEGGTTRDSGMGEMQFVNQLRTDALIPPNPMNLYARRSFASLGHQERQVEQMRDLDKKTQEKWDIMNKTTGGMTNNSPLTVARTSTQMEGNRLLQEAGRGRRLATVAEQDFQQVHPGEQTALGSLAGTEPEVQQATPTIELKTDQAPRTAIDPTIGPATDWRDSINPFKGFGPEPVKSWDSNIPPGVKGVGVSDRSSNLMEGNFNVPNLSRGHRTMRHINRGENTINPSNYGQSKFGSLEQQRWLWTQQQNGINKANVPPNRNIEFNYSGADNVSSGQATNWSEPRLAGIGNREADLIPRNPQVLSTLGNSQTVSKMRKVGVNPKNFPTNVPKSDIPLGAPEGADPFTIYRNARAIGYDHGNTGMNIDAGDITQKMDEDFIADYTMMRDKVSRWQNNVGTDSNWPTGAPLGGNPTTDPNATTGQVFAPPENEAYPASTSFPLTQRNVTKHKFLEDFSETGWNTEREMRSQQVSNVAGATGDPASYITAGQLEREIDGAVKDGGGYHPGSLVIDKIPKQGNWLQRGIRGVKNWFGKRTKVMDPSKPGETFEDGMLDITSGGDVRYTNAPESTTVDPFFT